MSTQIKYKDRVVVAFESGTAILHTNGEKFEGDLEIMSTGGGGDKFKSMVDGSITEVTAEDLEGVTKFRPYAFAGSYLASITIPNHITAIPGSCFPYTQLKSINIPDSVTTIGSSAFSGCTKFEEVSIGSGVTNIGNAAFSGCTVLKKITCNAVTPPALGTNVFLNVPYNCMIYVPEESVSAYKADTNWAARSDYIFAKGSTPISFIVDGWTCIAEDGMTWDEYVGSPYNTRGCGIHDNYVTWLDMDEYCITTDGTTFVTKDQPIIPDHTYSSKPAPYAFTFTVEGAGLPNGSNTYILAESKTFQQLIEDKFDGGVYYNDGGYVGCYWPEGILHKNSEKVLVTYQIQNGDVFTVA